MPITPKQAWEEAIELVQWMVAGRCWVCEQRHAGHVLWSDDAEPWGVEFEETPNGNCWRCVWHVARESGEGQHIATFEFEDHAQAFVTRCGPPVSDAVRRRTPSSPSSPNPPGADKR